MRYKSILKLGFDTPSFQEGINAVLKKASEGGFGYATFTNVHMTMEAFWDKTFHAVVESATYVFADGKPLAWALSKKYKQPIERIAGMDFLPAILPKAEALGLPVYFFGGSAKVLQAVVEKSKALHPQLVIAGSFSPPFQKNLDPNKHSEYAQAIKASGAKLVFVALGCPKQENWMHRFGPQTEAFCLGVGGAFPVFAGLESRAPEWIRNMGLEWLHRLLQDPKRLWKRYFVTNSLFIWHLSLEFITLFVSKDLRGKTPS